MVRKTKVEAAVTREQLLDAAERVFRDRGVAKTSLAEVAAAAGVTRGAVYWHFRDKADLFDAMCERATLPLDAMLVEAGGRTHDDPLGAVRALAVSALTRLATDPRAQAVFEVIFHTDLTGELAHFAGRPERWIARRGCRCDLIASRAATNNMRRARGGSHAFPRVLRRACRRNRCRRGARADADAGAAACDRLRRRLELACLGRATAGLF